MRGQQRERPLIGAIYPRVSSAKQEDGYSLDSQQAAMIAFAAERGIQVPPEHIYREVHTGEELWERPALNRLRDAIKQRAIDVAIFYAVDRFARRQIYFEIVLEECRRAGVDVLFVTQSFDETPEGTLLRSIASYVAEKELYAIKERTMRGKLARMQSGRPYGGGPAPFGFRWVNGPDPKRDRHIAYEEDPDTAPVIRRIFAAALKGKSLYQICNELNAEGTPGPAARGRPAGGRGIWVPSTVAYILDNPLYKGVQATRRWKWVRQGGHKRGVRRPQDEWLDLPEGTVPALVSPDVWDAVQQLKSTNPQRAARSAKHPELFLLRGGFIRCGECGATMRAMLRRDGYHQYQCGNLGRVGSIHRPATPGQARVPSPGPGWKRMDNLVWERVSRALRDADYLAEAIARQEEGQDDTQGRLDRIDQRIKQLTAERDERYAELRLFKSEASKAPIAAEIDRLSELLQQVQFERERLAGEAQAHSVARDDLEGIIELTRSRLGLDLLDESLDELPYAEKRRALAALSIELTVYHGGRWELDGSLPLPSDPPAQSCKRKYL